MIEEVLIDDEKNVESQENTEYAEIEELIDELVKDATDEIVVPENKKTEEVVTFKKENIKFHDVLFNRKTKVFVKLNADGYITQIDSDVFLKDTTGWIEYDEGEGDRYVHAQTIYFEDSLVDEDGNYRYKV